MTPHPRRQPLPPEVLARREVLLAELIGVQRTRVRTRVRTRQALRTLAALLAISCGVGTFALLRSGGAPLPDRAPAFTDPRIEVVQGSDAPVHIEWIDDDELIDELRAAGINAGLARMAGRVYVVGK